MNQLIAISNNSIGDATIQTVNARELWEFMQSKRQFADWIKERIDLYGFVQDVDFIQFHKKVNGSVKPLTEYHLSLDMAKELSMVERNKKGKQARQYFIECERRAKSAVSIPQTLPEALRSAADLAEQNALLAPKAAVADRIANSDGWFCLRDSAKILKMTERKFIEWLLINKWLYRDQKGKSRGHSEKTPRYVNHKVVPIPVDGDQDRVSMQPMIMPEVLTRLASIFNVESEVAA